jgi:hypothetical protein
VRGQYAGIMGRVTRLEPRCSTMVITLDAVKWEVILQKGVVVFCGEGGRFGNSQQKLSLPQLSIFHHSLAFAPSGLFIFLWFWLWRLLLSVPRLGPAKGAGAWMGTVGRVAFPGGVFPMLRIRSHSSYLRSLRIM